jgi:glycerophosphoryl diester phosphodiesterase
VVDECHANGLLIHIWTMRNDDLQFTTTPFDENNLYLHSKIDGIFTEYVETTFITYQQELKKK